MSKEWYLNVRGEEQMMQLGRHLAALTPLGCVIFLHGDLGAGKTTLVRGILRGLGHQGGVKSPTYTLVEHYAPGGKKVYHFDLYRMADPAELEYLGYREFFHNHSICLLEWPEHGQGYLPQADVELFIDYVHAGERYIRFVAHSEAGREVLRGLRTETGPFSA